MRKRAAKAEKPKRATSPTAVALRKHLGRNVRQLREAAGWTQAEAAWQCNVSEYFYQQIEWAKANTSIAIVAALMDAFEVGVGELFDPKGVEKKRT